MAMSRRHYIAAGGEVIPEGCVFLAPLGENDLKDKHSGSYYVKNLRIYNRILS